MEQTIAPRHAYLITAHNKPAQLLLLLRLLDDPQNDIFIHIDKKATDFSEVEMKAAAPNSRVSFVPRQDARWGSEVFIDVIVLLLREASKEEHVFYHLLSGADLPLKPQKAIHAFFESHAGEEFVAFDHEVANMAELQERIGRFRLMLPIQPAVRKIVRFIDQIFQRLQGIFKINRIKGNRTVFQKGAVWFSITHAFTTYALEQMPRYRGYYRHSSCADEIWLQTILANSPFMERRAFMGFDDELAATMRYVDWSGNAASPRTLTSADFDLLMESGMLFARKFDESVDAGIIQRISDTVLKSK